MATDSEVIKEFLVSLGFKIDAEGAKRFDKGLQQATKTATRLGAVMAALAVAVEVGVSRVARNFEALYYASQRTQATGRNLKALEYGASRIGLSAEAARAQVEGLAKAIRSNPGVEGLVNNLGVATREKNGQLRDTTVVLSELVAQFSKMPFHIAAQFAAQLGIDADALLMLQKGYKEATAAQEDYKKRLKDAGVDVDAMAEKSKVFANLLRRLDSNFEILTTRLADSFMPMATRILEIIDFLIVKFTAIDKETSGWAGTITSAVLGLATAFTILGRAVLMNPIGLTLTAISAAILLIITNWDDLKSTMNSFFEWVSPKLQWFWDKTKAIGEFFGFKFTPSSANSGPRATTPPAGSGTIAGGPRDPIGLRNNNPGNLRQWAGAETSGGFARFRTAEEGLEKMAANLINYGKRGFDTLDKISHRWAPNSDGNDSAGYARSLARQTGFSTGQKLDLNDPETLKKLMAAITVNENGRNPYSADMIDRAVATRLGGGAGGRNVVTMNQRTEINVASAGSADSTARVVAQNQTRVNGDMVRNMEGAIR